MSLDYTSYFNRLVASYETVDGFLPADSTRFPSLSEVKVVLVQLQRLLFPIHRDYVTPQRFAEFTEHLFTLLSPGCEHPQALIEDFLLYLPQLRLELSLDARAHFDGDPAATSLQEVILAYPGFFAITVHRISHFFYLKKVPLIPRLMSEYTHSRTGIDIHPGAQIGASFCIDHGTGIVIGETSVLGSHVKLYQGVTLGAISIPKKGIIGKRHPTLGDRVTVYSGTTILGGETHIGADTIIGGNAWVTASIPANSKVYLTADQRQVLKTELEDTSALFGMGI
jgi:serine O-acetyltransferase